MKRNLAVTGKTMLAPNIATTVIRESKHSSTQPICQKVSSKAPTPRIQSKLKSTDQTTVSSSEIKETSKESMTLLKKQIDKLTKLTKDLTLYNHSMIFTETDILNELNTLKTNFQAFYHDSVYYYKAVKAVEESFFSTRTVPNTALKSSSLTFGTNWRNVNSLFIKIQKNGKKSLASYIESKYKTMDQIICQITATDQQNIHMERISKSALKLRESSISQSKHVALVLKEKDIHNATKVMEDMLSDVKQLVQQFGNDCFQVFSNCAVPQTELKQCKSLFNDAGNEILVALRAFFSFDSDMKVIGLLINEISEHIQQIINIAELPPCPIHACPSAQIVQATIRSRAAEPIRCKSSAFSVPISPLLTPAISQKNTPPPTPTENTHKKGFPKSGSMKDSLTLSHEDLLKIESIFTEMRKMFRLTIPVNVGESGDVVKKLEEIQNEIKKKQENDVEDQKEKENEVKESKLKLKKRIEELQNNVECSENYAKSLENQLREIEEKGRESREKNVLEKVVERMSSMVSESESDFQFMNNDVVTKADKLSLFIIERKCTKCMEHEKFEHELMMKLGISSNCGETIEEQLMNIQEKVSGLNQEVLDKENEIKTLEDKMNEKDEEIQKMKESAARIKSIALGIARENSSLSESDQKSIEQINETEDLVEVALAAFEKMKEAHKEKIQETTDLLVHKHQEELKEIADALDMCDEETVAAITRCVMKVKEELEQSKNAVQERDRVLNKLDIWMNDHIVKTREEKEEEAKDKSIDEKFQGLMFQFDESPNPLEKPYEELTRERRNMRTDIEKVVSSISKFFTGQMRNEQISKQLQRIKTLKITDLVKLNNEMVTAIAQSFGKKESMIVKLKAETVDSKKSMVLLCEKVNEFLEKPKPKEGEEVPEKTLYELTTQLTQLIDEVCNSGTDNFVPKEMLIKETKPIKKIINCTLNNPKVFMQTIVSTILDAKSIIDTAGVISSTLDKAFQKFDFTCVPDITNKNFTNARDLVYQINSIIGKAQTENENKIGMPIANIISKYTSILSSMFSLIAMMSFGTPGALIAK